MIDQYTEGQKFKFKRLRMYDPVTIDWKPKAILISRNGSPFDPGDLKEGDIIREDAETGELYVVGKNE